jgi:hypothetical protein
MSKNKHESGQALLIVIFAITLGLVTLVAVSSRIVNSTKRVFIDSAYYKAQAAAEAGAEKFLAKTSDELAALLDVCTTNLYTPTGFASSIDSRCVLGSADGFTETRAVMAVESYPSGDSYEVSSPANSTVSVNLGSASGSVKVCWHPQGQLGSEYSEVLSFYYFLDNADQYRMEQQKYVCGDFVTWCTHGTGVYESSDSKKATDLADGDYACFNLDLTSSGRRPQLLNLMSLVNGSTYRITFDSGTVPVQGYRITSVGEVVKGTASLTSSNATRKKVVVEKSSMPNLGPWFNFAVTSVSGRIVAE